MRRTLRAAVECRGVGLHTGEPAQAVIRPADAGEGIRFRRADVAGEGGLIPARYDAVVDTRLCTRLGNAAGTSVGTVEHLMAALAGSGVTDALVEVSGPEVPIMDGSALPFLSAFARAGLADLDAPLAAIRVERPVEVESDGRRARLVPAPAAAMAFEIAFDDPAIGAQALDLPLAGDAVAEALADCRTFGLLAEVEQLRRLGLARGGTLENAVVVDRGRVLNPGGLRRPDEFVRHKMLDAVGDLALAGAPVIGRYEGVRAGHEITNLLLRALFDAPGAWSWCEAAEGTVPRARLPLSARTGDRTAVAV
jgi:UDP-3-O-[3-hydroxymyristoyl] N-acetylglucosamine deacetylase